MNFKNLLNKKRLHELVIFEFGENADFIDLKGQLQDVMRRGECGIAFANACSSYDQKIKRIGYLGAIYLKDELKIIMTNTLLKDIENGNKDLALCYIANTNYNYEIQVQIEDKKSLIAFYKLTRALVDVNLVGYDEKLFFIKLQLLLDSLLRKPIQDYDSLQIGYVKRSDSQSNTNINYYGGNKCEKDIQETSHGLYINEMQKDFICSLYTIIQDKYVKLKLLQVYKIIKKVPKIDHDVSNSIYLAPKIDIAISAEICGLVKQPKCRSFVYKLLQGQGDLLILGLRLAREHGYFPENAIDVALREMAVRKYKKDEMKKKEILRNISIQKSKSENEDVNFINTGIKPSKTSIKIDKLDDFQQTIIKLLNKTNYKTILKKKDPHNSKWIPIILEIFKVSKKSKILLENPVIAYFLDAKKYLKEEKFEHYTSLLIKKLEDLTENIINRDNEEKTKQTYTGIIFEENIFNNTTCLIELIFQLLNHEIGLPLVRKSILHLLTPYRDDFYGKNKVVYHTLYRICNFLLRYGDLEKNRILIENFILEKNTPILFKNTLLEAHELFNVVLPIKSVWVSAKGMFFHYKIGEFVEFFDKFKLDQDYFKQDEIFLTENRDDIIVENSTLLLIDQPILNDGQKH